MSQSTEARHSIFSLFAADVPPVQSVLQLQRALLEIEQKDLMTIAWAYSVICKKKKRESTAGGSRTFGRSGKDNEHIPTSGQGATGRWREVPPKLCCLASWMSLLPLEFQENPDRWRHFLVFPHPNSHSHGAPIATWSDSFFSHRIPRMRQRTEKRT